MSAALPQLRLAEPPAVYLLRPPLVIDCSALAGLVFREPWTAQAEQQLAGHTLHAPHLITAELASVALKKMRLGEAHAEAGLLQATALDITLHAVPMGSLVPLARRYRLSAYDACYLWLAAELRCPLATFDERLGDAAREHLASLGSDRA